jgi:cell division protein FtsW
LSEYLISIRDFTQAPLHLSRSLEALVKGGWFGVGIGRADTKLTGLPVPPTDSIFAVIGEEVGIVGSTAVVLLNVILLWRGLKIAQNAPDGLGRLLAAGLSIWLALEAFINMAVIVGLVPFAGNALPFISYGGSNLVVSLAAIGILLNISRVSSRSQEKEERALDAVIDLRRRDRRWGVSSPRRAKGASGR